MIRDEVIQLLDEAAEATGAEVIDPYRAMSDKPRLLPDTVHPNAEGANIIAEVVAPAVAGDGAVSKK